MAKNYYRGADAVVLVYDVTQARSFVDVPGWLEELENYSLDERKILQIIVANKVKTRLKRLSVNDRELYFRCFHRSTKQCERKSVSAKDVRAKKLERKRA